MYPALSEALVTTRVSATTADITGAAGVADVSVQTAVVVMTDTSWVADVTEADVSVHTAAALVLVTDVAEAVRAPVAGHAATNAAYLIRAALLAASAGATLGSTTTSVGGSGVIARDDNVTVLRTLPTTSTVVSSTVVASTVSPVVASTAMAVDSAKSSCVTCVSTVSISCCRCL